MRLPLSAPACAAAFVLSTSALVGQNPRIEESPDPVAAAEFLSGRYLVTFEGPVADLDGLRRAVRGRDAAAAAGEVADLERRTTAGRADFRAALEDLGGEVERSFWLVPVASVRAPGLTVEQLSALPGVRRVVEESLRRPGDARLLPAPIRTSTNALNHRADTAHQTGARGRGATVAVVDSGLDEVMGSAGRPHRTFYPNGVLSNLSGGGIGGSRLLANVQVGAQPADGNGLDHGTRVAGVAVGGRWNNGPLADDGHAPESLVVGYSLTDVAGSGITTLTTMVAAWQRCVVDAARYGTSVAVISYDGSRSPYSPEQQAMDAAAEVADLAVFAMAGNSARDPFFYQGAANVLAVGSVTHDIHDVSSFSATGPLAGPTAPRLYPHLVANGENIEMPGADSEGLVVTRSGTSYSAPQAAGAAALFRSIANGASQEETRAALLATLDDQRPQVTGMDDRIGHGYLRDDRLVELARGAAGATFAGSVDAARPVWTGRHAVTAGKVYAVGLAFSRRDTTAVVWSDLDVSVLSGGVELARSEGVDDTHHLVVFKAESSGNVDLVVHASRFESGRARQDFGLAIAENPRPIVRRYGQGCPSPVGIGSVRSREPLGLQGFGSTDSDRLIGGVPHRAQQWTHHDVLLAAAPIRGIAFRHDDVAAPAGTRSWVELEIAVGFSEAAGSAGMSTTFAQNGTSRRQTVLRRTRVALPQFAAPNGDPNRYDVLIPFDQSFSRLYDPLGGGSGTPQDLILDVRQFASSAGASALVYPIDAEVAPNLGRTLYAASPNATTGTILPGLVAPYALIGTLSGGVAPRFDDPKPAAINSGYRMNLDGAPTGALTTLSFGLSDRSHAGLQLPLDLGLVGAPGCFVFTSLEAVLPMPLFRNRPSANVAVPGMPALLGVSVHHQAFCLDPSVNRAGLITSDAIEQVIGFR